MKILRAYIENFGKLSKQEFIFDDGFNVINQNNGYGKTTLATFIKAMLYGMKSTTKKQLEQNEKKKYNPWQGGNFGGYLEFEVDDNKYKVERFFGGKDSEDTFSLIDLKTGKESNKFSEKLGEELFQLDEESFERCSFIPQKEIDGVISDKISAKLINMVQGTNNKESLENALNIIKERCQELKKRGNSGKISEVEIEINEISEEIDSLKMGTDALVTIQAQIKELDNAILSLEEEKEEISKKIKSYGEQQTLIANKKYYDEKTQQKAKLENQIKRCEEILNNEDFSEGDLKNIIEYNDEIVKNEAKIKSLEEKSLNEIKLEELQSFMKNKNVSLSQIDDLLQKEQKLKEINTKVDLEKELLQPQKQKWLNLLIFPILSVMFAILGVVIKTNFYSILLYILSVVSVVVSVVLISNKKNGSKRQIRKGKIFSVEFNNLMSEKKSIESEIQNFVNQFSDCEISNLTLFLYDLRSKINEINNLEEEIKIKKETIIKVKAVLKSLESNITEFFKKFNFDNKLNIIEKVNELKNAKEQQKILKVELNNVNNDLLSLNIINNDESVEFYNIEELQAEEKNKQALIDLNKEDKLDLINKIEKIKNRMSTLDELELKLEEKVNLKNELKKEYKTLNNVSLFLNQANDNLTAKYKKPLKDNLNKYLEIALGEDYYQFDIDTELNVSFEEFGKKREVDYLSKGYQAVINICTRFALIESLFKKEKPFIVLDDPFVNLDENKVKQMVNILKEFSKEYQIIYFVCHKSRV